MKPQPTTSAQVEYPSSAGNQDGLLAELPSRMAGSVDFDSIRLQGGPASRRFTLWFRQGTKRIFHVRVLRKGGRYLVVMGGLDPAEVLRGIAICRNHFDRWFGITPAEVRALEERRSRET